MAVSHRVFQKILLPLRKAKCTPAARAASTLARCAPDQYSSWPFDVHRRWFVMRAPLRSASTPVKYVTSYPLRSSHRTIGYSPFETQLSGSNTRVLNGRVSLSV